MCGIFCLLGEKSSSLDISKVLKTQNHRGPDYSDFLKINNLVLGSNRLKIIDLDDKANMPFSFGSIILIFNGFISNYKTLKEEMIKTGINFKTNCDTEVLAAMLDVYPYEVCISKLEGMWSFIAYDKRKEQIIISRDDYGIKPLFYFQDEKNLIFASEINTLFSFLNLSIDYTNVGKYFFADSFNKDPFATENTFFKNVYSYPASSYSILKLNKKQIEKLSFQKINRKFSNERLTNKEFYNLMERKFDEYKSADVKKCVPLSGGIDSNVINYFFRNEKNTSTLSISDMDLHSDNNETNLIKKTVKNSNIPHEFVDTDQIISFDFFKNLISKFKNPVSSPVVINSAALRYSAKKNNIKVLYSGNGGDELFGGYPQQFIFYLKYLIKNKKFYKAYKLLINGSTICASGKNTNKIIKNYISGLKNSIKLTLSDNYLKNKSEFHNKKFFNSNFDFKADDNMFFANPKEYNLHLIKNKRMPYWLATDDFVSSMYSIENRVPFLNQELVYMSQKIYDENNFHQRYTKYKIRKLFKNKVSKHVIENKIKLNQPGSFDNFIFGKLFSMNRDTLENSSFFDKKIITELDNKKKLFDNFRQDINYRNKFRSNASFLFKALCFEIFLKTSTKN